jgi:outer membrane protein TolC
MKKWHKIAFGASLLLGFQTGFAQSTASLDECYEWARAAFPLLQQKDIIAANATMQARNVELMYLPQVSLNAQATYQSDVSGLPATLKIPGIEVKSVNKDQYKATLDIQQIIWDGGVIAQQKNNLTASSAADLQRIEVEAYKIRERVNTLFFTILQIDENAKLIKSVDSDLATRIKKTSAMIENGTSLKSPLYSLQAEQLKNEQRLTELQAQRSATIGMLNVLTNKSFTKDAVFTNAVATAVAPDLKVQRPELQLFDLQNKAIDQQVKSVSLKNQPKVMAFGTLGYGNPGLNFLKNEFAPYAIGGVQFKWNLQDLYNPTIKNEMAILKANQKITDLQRDLFVQNTQIAAKQYSEEIVKLDALIATDKKIIALREKIKTSASAQVDNGVITTADYLLELSAETQAKQSLILHETQLAAAKVYLQTVLGL